MAKMLSKKNTSGRKWFFLPILDHYILTQFLIPFSVLIIGFILLFIIGDIFNDLQDFLEANTGDKAKLPIMIKYFILLLPGNVRFILPISILLACMYTMANFGKNMEVTAMRASGVSLVRCGGSIYLVGLIVTGITFWFNEQLVPVCERQAEILKDKTTRGEHYRSDLQNMLTFVSPNKKRTWLFKYFDVNGVQKEVLLKKYQNTLDSDNKRKLQWDLQAKEAKFIPGQGWEFVDAVLTPYTDDGFMQKQSLKYPILKKSIDELPETPEQIINAVKPPEELPVWTIYEILKNTKDMAENCKNVYRTVFYYRLAFPWACFLAVFLGVPLAAKNERAGVFKSIILAVVVIVGYQMASEVFLILGKRGFLNPIVAGLAPTGAFIAYGWRNIIRQT